MSFVVNNMLHNIQASFEEKLRKESVNILTAINNNPELSLNQKIILDVITMVTNTLVHELMPILQTKKLSKEEFAKMFFQETKIIAEIRRDITKELKRELFPIEESLIADIAKMFENILAELYLEF